MASVAMKICDICRLYSLSIELGYVHDKNAIHKSTKGSAWDIHVSGSLEAILTSVFSFLLFGFLRTSCECLSHKLFIFLSGNYDQ
ncbi:Hypothetical predicted protein [Octopus vulgaris]|uniref:Uncharacterized protein n=1 Tax=Octopus vulgaris TaxID=6645 RepID=A0AA36F7H9_OCTVU|nr:Hypothetical predicted protein [Octopus vulgaris]